MGRKPKKNKRVTLTLSEFNVEGGGDPELLSLPSAPKAQEEWDAEGGKPEYNSRGYRERLPGGASSRLRGGREFGAYGGSGAGSDDVDHDWTRRGPIDGNQDDEGRGERDWSDMRRSTVDAGNDMPERDWKGMRRGPVDSSFQSRGGVNADRGDGGFEERDWSQRVGPMDANEDTHSRPAANWSDARGGRVVESKFHSHDSGPGDFEREPNWSQRRGPIEAAMSKPQQGFKDDDWAAPRKGPVESEFEPARSSTVEERDWSERRGPVEATISPAQPTSSGSGERERDWSDRRGPVEAVIPQEKEQAPNHSISEANDDDDQDWSAVRSSASPPPSAGAEADTTKPRDSPGAEVDEARSEWTRRGPVRSKAEMAAEHQAARQHMDGEGNARGRGKVRQRRGGGSFGRYESETGSRLNSDQNLDHQSSGSGSWRRDVSSGMASRGRRSRNSYGRPVSSGFENSDEPNSELGGDRERDWGAARRSMPGGRAAKPSDKSGPTTGGGNVNEGHINEDDHVLGQVKSKGTKVESINEVLNTEGTSAESGAADATEDDEWTTVRGNYRRDARMSHNEFNSSSAGRWRGSGGVSRSRGRSFERNADESRSQNEQNLRAEGEHGSGPGFDRFNSLGIDMEAETDSGDIDVDEDGDREEDPQVAKEHSPPVKFASPTKAIAPTNA